MPVKNRLNPNSDSLVGEITSLSEKEKEILQNEAGKTDLSDYVTKEELDKKQDKIVEGNITENSVLVGSNDKIVSSTTSLAVLMTQTQWSSHMNKIGISRNQNDKFTKNKILIATGEHSTSYGCKVKSSSYTIEELINSVTSKSSVLMKHHFTIEGTADNYPFALSFTVSVPYNNDESLLYTKITTKENLLSLLELYSYQDNCNGYYISFNVDVLSFGVNGLKYYQNSSLSILNKSKVIEGITSITDDLQTIPLKLQ